MSLFVESRSEAGELLISVQITDAGLRDLLNKPALKALLPDGVEIRDLKTDAGRLRVDAAVPWAGRIDAAFRLESDEPG